MNVLVTGGGTVAPIDDVRQISNVSTGRFSSEISEVCLERGCRVWHIQAPGAMSPYTREAWFDLADDRPEREVERLSMLRKRYRAVRERLHLCRLATGSVSDYSNQLETILKEQRIDVAFLAMAVSDYEPVAVPGKIDSTEEEYLIRCRRTTKVIQRVRDWSPRVFLVGFKLLSGVDEATLVHAARRACDESRADVTLANDLRLLRSGRHTVHLVGPGMPTQTFPPGPDLASRVVSAVFSVLPVRSRRPDGGA
jgi:phosphopantothenate-cysteine ligase